MFFFSTYVEYSHALRFIFVSWKFKPYHSEVAWIPFLNPPWIAPGNDWNHHLSHHFPSLTANDWDHFCFFSSFHGNKDAKWWLNDGQRPNMIKWAQTMISHPVSPSMMESKSWNHSPEAVHKIVAGQTMPWRHCSSLFATAPWWDPLRCASSCDLVSTAAGKADLHVRMSQNHSKPID